MAGGKEHFILLMTRGKSLDRVTEIAQTLRDRNINVSMIQNIVSSEKYHLYFVMIYRLELPMQ